MVKMFFLIMLSISACQTAVSDIEMGLIETPIPTITSKVTPTRPIPTSTQEESNSVSAGLPDPTKSATPEKRHQLCSPLSEHEIQDLPSIVSDPYAPPPPGKDDRHHGVDFSYYNQEDRESIEGEGVKSIFHGRVAAVLNDRLPYGNMVIIETQREDLWPELIQYLEINSGESLYHLYAHLGQLPLVSLGQEVECGQVIGEVGKTGYNIPIPHLHLETRVGPAGMVFESMAFYDTRATEEEMGNYKQWRISGEFRHIDPMEILAKDWQELSHE
jgi:murein DD-endopeptidase MepM/ murein hydrolase activator NlpD